MHDEDEGGEVQEDDLVGSKPLVEDNPPVQPNPMQRPREPINTPVSPAPHATIDNNGSNGLTYRNSAVDQGTRRNNLVQ